MLTDDTQVYEENESTEMEEMLFFRKYIKYRREGLISTGNYNWLIVDPSLVNYQNLEKKIKKYCEHDGLHVNLIRDVNFFNRKNDFCEEDLINAIVNEGPATFKDRLANVNHKQVNIIVISTFTADIAKVKFGQYCTFFADLSKAECSKATVDGIYDTVHKNNFEIENKAILEELDGLPIYEVDRILTKAFISGINNKSTAIDDYVDLGKSDETPYLEELDNLVGLGNVKKSIIEVINYIKISKKRKDIPCLHMAFLGNPGTGKTTVAKIVGHLLSEIKILGVNAPFVEVSREKLVGRYIGHTEKNVKEAIENARGGVLFIDEAYSLTSNRYDNDFGNKAIDVLVNQLEIHRNDICVIFAGYHDMMLEFLHNNPGLESRVPFKIEFNDYNEEELFNIFQNFVSKSNLKFEPKVEKRLLEHFRMVKRQKDFGNGRYIRNFVERIKIKQANRIINNDSEEIDLITVQDIQEAIESMKSLEGKRVKIGF